MASRYGAVSPLLDRDSIEVRRGQSGEQDSSPHQAPNESPPNNSSLRSDSIGERRFDGVVREKLNDEASWFPAALRRRSLLAFIAAYAVLILVLAVLFGYSNQHDGLASSDEKYHYLWTYGPTAVFTIVAAFWAKVDYRSKQLAPWTSLAAKPSPAKQSLLLDYVSAWNIKAFYSAASAKHFNVVCAISGTLLLQLAIVFSTGLFALEQRTVTSHDVPITTHFRFANASQYVDGRAFMKSLAIRDYHLDYPLGTTETFAYQTFNASRADLPSNATITTAVDAFCPDLICESLSNANFSILDDFDNTQLSGAYQFDLDIADPNWPNITGDGYRGVPLASLAGYLTGAGYIPTASALLLWVGHVELDEHNWTRPYMFNTTKIYRNGKASASAIACKPKYEIRRAQITMDGTKLKEASLIMNDEFTTLPDVSASSLLDYFLMSSDSAFRIISGTNVNGYYGKDNVTIGEPIFLVMNSTMARPSAKPGSWMEPDFLIESAQKSFQSVASQLVLSYITEPVNGTTTGTMQWKENRMVIRPLSFYLIVALLVVLIGIALILYLRPPIGVVPRDPGSIAGLATIVASSAAINAALDRVGHSHNATEARLMALAPYHTTVGHGGEHRQFLIEASPPNVRIDNLPRKASKQQEWWRPFHMTLAGQILVLITPLAGIATIEALYQRSRHFDGIAAISMNGYARYAWVYVPALVIWALNACFESVYNLSTILHPYEVLRRRDAEAEGVLTRNLMGKLLIENTWSALLHKRFAVLFASLTVLLGAILPIAVAGLYVPNLINQSVPFSLQQKSWFNASKGFSANISRDGLGSGNGNPIPNLILYNNMTFPRGTYGTYALGETDLPAGVASAYNGSGSYVTVPVPAVRGRSNCTIASPGKIDAAFDPNTWRASPLRNYLQVNQTLASGCLDLAGELKLEPVRMQHNDYYFGKLTGAYATIRSTPDWLRTVQWNGTVDQATYHSERIFPAHCPRATIMLGKATYQNTTNNQNDTLTDIKVLQCWPYVERVLLNTTFSLPTMEIQSANLLSRDSGSGPDSFFSEAEIMQYAGFPVGSRQEPASFAEYFAPLNTSNTSTMYFFDQFVEPLVWGRDGVPAAELLANPERLVERVDEVYGIVMAQLYNRKARVALSTPDAQAVLNGTIFTKNQYRVVQSLISTRILEAVLAAMFVCCAIAFSIMKPKGLLPQNPCSIGAAASLLAGSNMLDRSVIPKGSEFLSDRDMEREGLFQGLRFRLGWWGEGKDRRFGIDVVGAGREK